MVSTQVLLLFIAGFSLNFQKVFAAKKCYKCTSAFDPTCDAQPFTGSSDYCVTTTDEEINCIKYVYKFNGLNVTYRGCRVNTETCDAEIQALKVEKKEVIDCCLCSTDLCTECTSSALPLKPFWNFLVVSIPMLFIKFL